MVTHITLLVVGVGNSSGGGTSIEETYRISHGLSGLKRKDCYSSVNVRPGPLNNPAAMLHC